MQLNRLTCAGVSTADVAVPSEADNKCFSLLWGCILDLGVFGSVGEIGSIKCFMVKTSKNAVA